MRIWEILQGFTERERKKFPLWLEAELEGKHTDILQFVKGLLEFDHQPEKEILWRHVFPHKPYKNGRFRRIVYEIKAKLKLFLAFSALKHDKDQLSIFYLRQLHQLGNPTLFESEAQKLLTDLEKSKLPSLSYYELLYRIHTEIRHHNLTYKIGTKDNLKQGQQLSELFDPWWIHEKYLLACMGDSLERVYGKDIPTSLLAEAEAFIQQHPDYARMKYLQLLILIMNMQEDAQTEEIFTHFQEVAKERNKYHSEEFSHIYIYLINRTVRLFHQVEASKFAHLLFRLYGWGIEHRSLLHENHIPPASMRAWVHTGLFAEETGEVSRLMPLYLQRVVPHMREEVGALCQAKLLFQTKAFSAISKLLFPHTYRDKLTEIESRIIQLQTRYELAPVRSEELEVPLSTLDRFIEDQQHISEHYKSRYLKVVRIFLRMVKLDRERLLHKLWEEVGPSVPHSMKGWLREKIQQKIDKL